MTPERKAEIRDLAEAPVTPQSTAFLEFNYERIATALSELLDSLDNAEDKLEFIRDEISPLSARPCPACVYDDGEFIRRCKLHEQLDEAARTVEFLEAAQQVSPADLIDAVDENNRLTKAFSDALNKLPAGLTLKLSGCEWCEEMWPHLDGQPREETLRWARKHAFTCENHPLRIERDALRAEVTRLRELNGDWAETAAANLAESDVLRAKLAKLSRVLRAVEAWRDTKWDDTLSSELLVDELNAAIDAALESSAEDAGALAW